MSANRRTRLSERGRDPQHHNCVDRQVYRALTTGAAGFTIAAVLPIGYALVALLVGAVVYAVMELSWDGEQRRRAKLTDDDRRAGRH